MNEEKRKEYEERLESLSNLFRELIDNYSKNAARILSKAYTSHQPINELFCKLVDEKEKLDLIIAFYSAISAYETILKER